MALFQIKDRYFGKVLFACEAVSLKECVETAVAAGATLAGANLTFAKLSGAKLSGADLAGANLVCANLTGANLTFAKLAGAKLSGAKLSGADLTGADFVGANAGVRGHAMNPTIDELIHWHEQMAQIKPPSEAGHYRATAEQLKRLKSIDDGRGEWVDTSNRE